MWCTKHRMKGLHTKQKSLFLRDYWTKSDGVLPKWLSTQAICNFKLLMLKVWLYLYILYIIIFPPFLGGGGRSAFTFRCMEVGLARAGLDDFFALLGIPPPITIGSYNKQAASLLKSVQKVCSCGFPYFPFLSISFVKLRKLTELIIKIKGPGDQNSAYKLKNVLSSFFLLLYFPFSSLIFSLLFLFLLDLPYFLYFLHYSFLNFLCIIVIPLAFFMFLLSFTFPSFHIILILLFFFLIIHFPFSFFFPLLHFPLPLLFVSCLHCVFDQLGLNPHITMNTEWHTLFEWGM